MPTTRSDVHDLIAEARKQTALLARLVALLEARQDDDTSALTYAQAATRLQVSASTIGRMVQAGTLHRLPGVKRQRIALAEIERYETTPTTCSHCGRRLDPDGSCPDHPAVRRLEVAR